MLFLDGTRPLGSLTIYHNNLNVDLDMRGKNHFMSLKFFIFPSKINHNNSQLMVGMVGDPSTANGLLI